MILFLAAVFSSCTEYVKKREVISSFAGFMQNLEEDDLEKEYNSIPFLAKMSPEDQGVFLDMFRGLIGMDYSLKVSGCSEGVCYLRIVTKNSNPVWDRVVIPYRQNAEGIWVMEPVIRKVQSIDFVPAKE